MPMFRNLEVTNLTAQKVQPKQIETTTLTATTTLDSTYYGKTVFVSGTPTTITLPANGAPAGSWMRFVIVGDNNTNPSFAAATADTLIIFNDQAADSFVFDTANRIGASVEFISTGTYWVAILDGKAAVTITTA
jgi:hypothetical protein